ncbi:MAG: hypothetical protein ABJK39_13680 [Hyphomicrobiales bacterium]
MPKLLSILSCSAAMFWALTAAASDDIAGTYEGVIWSGIDTAGTTVFSVSNSGKISGVYEFDDDNGLETGELTACKLTGVNLYCIWNDKYGSGDFNVEFSADFSSFDGLWFDAVGDLQNRGNAGGHTWNGQKS